MTTINAWLLIRPDWSEAVIISRLWRTGLQKAIASPEKRDRIFSWARLGTRFIINSLDYSETANIRRKVLKFQGGIMGVPVWPDRSPLTAQAAAAQKDVTIGQTTDKFFTPGRNVVLMDPADPESFESGVIDSVTATVITLVDNLDSTWNIGDEILPVIPARIGDNNSFRWFTDIHTNIRIDAREAFE